MKITDVRIDGFGVWSNLSVHRLDGETTVFYGPNEAGKTTLMQFIRTMLYGFSRERRQRYLPPVHGGRPGGLLHVTALHGDFAVQRHIRLDDAPESLGDLQLLDDGGTPLGTHQLSSILGGVDESIFTNVFAIGLREMQELGALNDSAAADHLYKLTSGLDRVSLIDVVRDLGSSREKIFAEDGRPGQLTQLLQRREKLQSEIEEHATRGRRWPQLMAERAERGREIEQTEHGIADVQKQIHNYDLLLSVRDKWAARRQVDEQLAVFGGAADLPTDALEQLDAANAKLKKYKRRLHGARKRRSALREDLARHVYHRALVAQASRISALGEHAPWIGALEDEVARLQSEAAALEREMESRRPQLETAAGSKTKLPEITPKTLALLRQPATRLHHLLKLVNRTEQEAAAIKMRSEQALQRVSTELQDLDESSLTAALEKAGARVSLLRRRIQVEERLEQLALQHNELEGQSHELFDWQVMPFEKMAWLFTSFVLSTVMILGGVFGGLLWGFSWFLGLLLTFCGFVGLGASVVWKLDWERNAERQWQSCERQLELLEQQLAEARAERDELDQQLPQGGGALDARLATAEKQLQHLEQLAPMDAQRHESGQHVDAAERRATQAAEDLKEAKKNWQNALRSAGLPDNLAPNDVRHLARSFRNMLSVRKQLHQRRDEPCTQRPEAKAVKGTILP
ncbi:MAG TPA: AAA family ATPase, partial [Pirellulaceae bacterium]|nr:AAA family ATPase [Pirellulaceae bacterium]